MKKFKIIKSNYKKFEKYYDEAPKRKKYGNQFYRLDSKTQYGLEFDTISGRKKMQKKALKRKEELKKEGFNVRTLYLNPREFFENGRRVEDSMSGGFYLYVKKRKKK